MSRRSRRSSGIPVLGDRSRSKSSARPSLKPDVASTKRAASIDRTQGIGLKRSSSLLSFKRSIGLTPTLGVKSASSSARTPLSALQVYGRPSSSATPASTSRSRSRSPYRIGPEKTSDKKWVQQEYTKVYNYFFNKDRSVTDSLKPPSIGSFVRAMDILLKEINPRIILNTTNYKEVVLNTLKFIGFPGTVSNSLLKTVNTMHSWPQVVSILGWLVDVVTFINDPSAHKSSNPLIELMSTFICKKYLNYNNGVDDPELDLQFNNDLAKALNIDEEKCQRAKQELQVSQAAVEEQKRAIEEMRAKREARRAEIARSKAEREEFYSTQAEELENDECEIKLLKSRNQKLAKSIEEKKKEKAALIEKISKQRHTAEEKAKLARKIEESRNFLEIRKAELKAQRYVKEQCEMQLAEARKELEKTRCHFNVKLRKLTVFDPKLADLMLNDPDFLDKDFKKEIEDRRMKITSLEAEILANISKKKQSILKIKKTLPTLTNQKKNTEKNVLKVDQRIRSLLDKKDDINQVLQQLIDNEEIRTTTFLEEIEEIKKSRMDLTELREKHRQLKAKDIEVGTKLDEKKRDSVQFFADLHDRAMIYFAKIAEIRNEVYDLVAADMELIAAEQDKLLEELQKLQEFAKKG